MAEIKVGTAVHRKDLSPILAIFRLVPEPGNRFPEYKPGQYIALRRDNCRLTKRTIHPDGRVTYAEEFDENGIPRRGPVTHSYSISSAPHETAQEGYLEFYIILETHQDGKPGRLTESLFQIDPETDNRITYFTKIAGDFTLEKRTAGFENVVMVGTGTGLAPFASMIKELHFQALEGASTNVRYTLFHGNRGLPELGYHNRLLEIAQAGRFDFQYIPTVSRPSDRDGQNPRLGKGRANNLLRSVFGLPMKEEEELEKATKSGGANIRDAGAGLERAVRPILPAHFSRSGLLERMVPVKTAILTCGNPRVMADVESIAHSQNIRCEKEEW